MPGEKLMVILALLLLIEETSTLATAYLSSPRRSLVVFKEGKSSFLHAPWLSIFT